MFILLDIDGVMLNAAPWKKADHLDDGFFAFETRAVSCLQKIVSETGASIVLTSSHKSKFSPKQWEGIFENRGIHVSVSCLDDNVGHLNRKEEIISWFRHGIREDFVIIDDDKTLNDLPSYLKDRCVITGSLIGLNFEAADKAIGILQRNRVTA